MNGNIGYYGAFNHHHIKRIDDTLKHSLKEFPRTFVLRVDLRLPDENNEEYMNDSTLITRFIESLKSQITYVQKNKAKQGKRTHPCNVRYVWAREFGDKKGKKHYHVALMLNHDVYCNAGTYYSIQGVYVHNLAFMIMEAWIRALKLHAQQGYQKKYYPLVEFVLEGDFYLNANKKYFAVDYDTVMRRLSYLAKLYSKVNSDGQRNFGCSQS
ncbi:TPA: inovirus Gp2 family protein [Cronobacter sakazakii]|nr:inovirus Gp2 family protein [Cronobacter sakazakii]